MLLNEFLTTVRLSVNWLSRPWQVS